MDFKMGKPKLLSLTKTEGKSFWMDKWCDCLFAMMLNKKEKNK